MGRVRLADVAAEAGVSVSAASLVLNNRPSRITEATAERVREVAHRLGYSPDVNARSLRGRRTKTIGLLSDVVVTTPNATGLIQGVQEAAWARDHLLLIANSEDDPERERRLVRAMAARRVDAYLYALMYHQRRALPDSLEAETVVGLDVDVEGRPSFVPDEDGGAASATKLLLAHGHRRIAHIQGNPRLVASTLRRASFEREVQAAGLEQDSIVVTMPAGIGKGTDADHGYQLALQLMALPEPPTAIFAWNDATAVGVRRALTTLGLEVPRDVSVVGFDDQRIIVGEVWPTLTTVALPHQEMGRLAANALIDLLEGKPVGSELQLVPCPLIERGSVSAPAR